MGQRDIPLSPDRSVCGDDDSGGEDFVLSGFDAIDEVGCTNSRGHEWLSPDQHMRTPCRHCGYEP